LTEVITTVLERTEDIHFLTNRVPMSIPEYPTGPDHSIPEMLISVNRDGTRIIKNPKKEFLNLGGPYEINHQYTPKPINLCGIHIAPDRIVSVKNYRLPGDIAEAIEKIGLEKLNLVDASICEERSQDEADLPELPENLAIILMNVVKPAEIIEP